MRLALLLSAAAFACPLPALARGDSPPLPPSGPAADYPMTIGEPYMVNGVTYTPADRMNSDEVGYAEPEQAGGTGISLAHHTLPLPSYAEVTSLRSGRTILVRVERRGPMSGNALVTLSPGAAAQLGIDGRTPVRVRRVNPPEAERALLRSGQPAPARMDTPLPLVNVLLRKLDPALVTPPAPPPVPTAPVAPPKPVPTALPAPVAPPKPVPTPAVKPAAKPAPAAKPVTAAKPVPAAKAPVAPAVSATPVKAPPPAASPAVAPAPGGRVVVQVGAFSTRERAEAVAAKVGGTVSPAGKLFRVRIGTFSSPAAAAAGLAKARGAGYSDARIQRAD